jgi:hypothetical protein
VHGRPERRDTGHVTVKPRQKGPHAVPEAAEAAEKPEGKDAAVAAETTAGADAGGEGAPAEGVIVRVTVTVAAYTGAGTVNVVAKLVENVDAASAESALLKTDLAGGSASESDALAALTTADGSADDASAPDAAGATEESGAAEEPGAADAAAPAPSTPPCAPVAAMRASASGAVSHVMDVPGLFTSGSAACA